MSEKVILSDTSCLIALDRISQLNILSQLFTSVYTTKEVAREFGEPLPYWVIVKEVQQTDKILELENLLDKGEASVIALALEMKDCILLIDEKKGRQVALRFGLSIAGMLQVILLAKQKGIILSVKEILQQLQENNFRYSSKLKDEILRLAGER